MPKQRRMNKQARHELVVSYQDEYMAAGRGKRGEILTLLGESTGYDRKYLCRLLRGKYRPHARRKQRGRHYGAALDDVLRVLFEAHDGICPERIHPNLLGMAEHLAAHGELRLTEEVREQLQRVSLSTLRRIRSRLCQDEPRLLRSRPRPRNDLRRQVPMKRISYQEKQPGHFEVDLVHHCGPSAQGDYLHTLQMVDVATGWSELRAVLGRSFRVMGDGFAAILERLPFDLVEIHPDNGSEFFNHHVLRFFGERAPGLVWSRSRPYQKNDNRFVEQRNGDLVRGYLGHERLDSVAQVHAVNELYELIWLYFNFFQPVRRLVDKQIEEVEGHTRIRRRFDDARPPFVRLCETGVLSQEQEAALRQMQRNTNPRRLREQIYAQIDTVFSLPGAVPGVTEDVHETLAFPLAV